MSKPQRILPHITNQTRQPSKPKPFQQFRASSGFGAGFSPCVVRSPRYSLLTLSVQYPWRLFWLFVGVFDYWCLFCFLAPFFSVVSLGGGINSRTVLQVFWVLVGRSLVRLHFRSPSVPLLRIWAVRLTVSARRPPITALEALARFSRRDRCWVTDKSLIRRSKAEHSSSILATSSFSSTVSSTSDSSSSSTSSGAGSAV